MKPLDTALENQFTPRVDSEGYVVGGTMTRSRSDAMGFLQVLRDAARRYPLDLATVVMPPGWPVDADGRGWTYLEVEQMQAKRHAHREAA